jgi:hypothetical protein
MAKNVCIVTGPMVGLRSTWFLEDTQRFARRLGKKIELFNLFDEILEQERAQPANAFDGIATIGKILDGYQYQFELLRQRAWTSIGRKIDRLPSDTSAVVRTAASIPWRGVNLLLKDHAIVAREIRPDTIVTLIDAEWKIQERMLKEYGKHALRAVARQKELGIPAILSWLGSEVSASEDWAEWCSLVARKRVRHLILGREVPGFSDRARYVTDLDGMAKLATDPEVPTFYASYSMTVATPAARKEINRRVWQLRRYGVVIDPASIELGSSVDPAHQDVVFAYTVTRDLRWDVEKVDAVAAFHPYTKNPPLSTGMMDELGHARAFRKERYLVQPSGTGSPFTKDNYVPAECVFKTGDELFAVLEKGRTPRLLPKYGAQVDLFKTWDPKKARTTASRSPS